ncbi:HAD family hydrolase [Pseudomonas coleopterorum]|uniref:HAD family hydrolase n=1 Tax=Pseudomonas coleopterorum TaxID=1605838 RepID=UPI00089D197C|nr:HAD family hydrolase [Pseudomonas coleopterorum]SED72954.1 FMN phosphatase YigB, HAD superfamily [Pseudomonas coleopterorum]
MKIAAVIFDAFGTLARITRPIHPYGQLLREGKRQGRKFRPDDMQTLMTHRLCISEAAARFGIKLTPDRLGFLEQALKAELASIEPFPDALEAIAMLGAAGMRTAICSNLAMPYGPAIQQIFPNLDGYGFSYEMGAMKPSPIIYRHTCDLMGVRPGDDFGSHGRVVMIGDSVRCDRDGPRRCGISGFLLRRERAERFSSLTDFAQVVLAYA